jgi:hypothetical protein
MLLNILHNANPAKFHLQVLNVSDKKYKEAVNKREMYEQYRWIVCGCLFVTGPETGVKLLNRLKEVFVETTLAGYGHGEEMFYLEVLDEFYDDIEKGYGDYHTILNNFLKPTDGFSYILHLIINNYYRYGYYRECYDCCKKVLAEIENYRVPIDYYIYWHVLMKYYLSALNYRGVDEAKEIVLHIRQLVEDIPVMKHFYTNDWENIEKEFEKCG